jgi:hypothetical protein
MKDGSGACLYVAMISKTGKVVLRKYDANIWDYVMQKTVIQTTPFRGPPL